MINKKIAPINSQVNATELRKLIEQIEHLEDEKNEAQNQIKEVLEEAKEKGFDVKVMRHVIRMRKMKQDRLIEEQQLLDAYTQALGINLA